MIIVSFQIHGSADTYTKTFTNHEEYSTWFEETQDWISFCEVL